MRICSLALHLLVRVRASLPPSLRVCAYARLLPSSPCACAHACLSPPFPWLSPLRVYEGDDDYSLGHAPVGVWPLPEWFSFRCDTLIGHSIKSYLRVCAHALSLLPLPFLALLDCELAFPRAPLQVTRACFGFASSFTCLHARMLSRSASLAYVCVLPHLLLCAYARMLVCFPRHRLNAYMRVCLPPTPAFRRVVRMRACSLALPSSLSRLTRFRTCLSPCTFASNARMLWVCLFFYLSACAYALSLSLVLLF